tara:strand:- start:1149 stop:1379 length:231 start_codon:yes stop_codon:yes gene_type:complete
MEKKPPTVKRSMSLSKKMNDDLVVLTEALGVNAHSYMINELAKSIQRDSVSFQIKSNTENQLSEFMATIASSLQEE